MVEKDDLIQVRTNAKDKRKAMFVLKCQGKDLSTVVRELIDKYAEEYDKMKEEMLDVLQNEKK